MAGWSNPPPVVIVAGDNDYFREREVSKAVEVAGKTGRRVERVPGGDRAEISRVLSSGGVFFTDKILCVVSAPEKLDAGLVVAHQERGDNSVTLMLHVEGELKAKGAFKTLLKAIPDKYKAEFKLPKPWKLEEVALKHCAKEASSYNLTIAKPITHALLTACGTDFGVLAFEIQKAATLALLEGSGEISAAHLKQSISPLGGLGVLPIVDGVALRSQVRIARAMASMRRSHTGGDPTMRVSAMLSRNAIQWLHAASLLTQGAGLEELSSRLNVNSYIVKTKILPTAKRWGEKRLVALLAVLAQVERGVRQGHVNPWASFEASLLRLCSDH